ncbi:hypothetical protein [Altericista sp. CCNU0014]|uniref:hypothetical protein n=1 Tax=Altericista sp. CCNU0014 TaxID=3082949 RepID=UPI00384F6CDC
MKQKPRKLTIAERIEHHQMTRVLRYWLQKAAEEDDPVAELHNSLQELEDSRYFADFDWEIIEIALKDVLHNQRTLQAAASETALEITGLSIAQRM